jgi:RNA polymerase sigma-70 factor (ECF subfamily)
MLLEKELIYECICGNRKAQKELYEKYSPLFFAVCMRYMPTKEDAEDVLVMGFTSIFAKLDTFKNESSLEYWMKQIIINTAIDTIRMNNKYYKINRESEDAEGDIPSMSENTTYSQINLKYIIEQIQQLSEGYRMIFNMHAIEGYSYEEISNRLGINVNTVGSQLTKARKILQRKLKDFKI